MSTLVQLALNARLMNAWLARQAGVFCWNVDGLCVSALLLLLALLLLQLALVFW